MTKLRTIPANFRRMKLNYVIEIVKRITRSSNKPIELERERGGYSLIN